jgi:predicted RND superfamily exporter protein
MLMCAGAVALTGIPGRHDPMRLETDALAYIDRSLPLYKDTRQLEGSIGGLSVLQAWVTAPEGRVLDPEILRGLEAYASALESDPRVGSVAGPTTLLRWSSYMTGQGDRLPEDPAAWPSLAAQLDALLLEEPEARGFVDIASLSHARLAVVHQGEAFRGVEEIKAFAAEAWARVSARQPALAACRLRVVGDGLVSARIAEHLVPTLTESFAITAVIIFLAFLVIFRSGAARLMAMIPSVFAILVMFLVMRLTSIPLNIATILIASTVLGASENDQIHFFYHYQERRPGGSVEQALRHALRIAGRGIMFATLINCGGFLALSLSGLPPMRQFGIMSASAFLLSMLASLLALPAALWIFSGQRPDDQAA